MKKKSSSSARNKKRLPKRNLSRRKVTYSNNKTIWFVLPVIVLLVAFAALPMMKKPSPQNPDGQVLGIFSWITDFLSGKKSSSNTAPDKPETASQKTLPDTGGSRVKGNAGEYYPYGDIKEETIALGSVAAGRGGVAKAELANGVHVYVVSGEDAGADDMIQLTPYYSMPTAANAPALSTELGYGFDLQFLDSERDFVHKFYVIFDLDSGKTVRQIQNEPLKKFYCLPTSVAFQPYACAYLNNVTAKDHTRKDYAVVTPARDENSHILWMNTTIPIGYDNLLVVEAFRQGTFIPQKLSKDLLKDLLSSNLTEGFAVAKVEAYTQGVLWDLISDTNLGEAISYQHVDALQDWLKLTDVTPKALAKLKQKKNLSDALKDWLPSLERTASELDSLMNERIVVGDNSSSKSPDSISTMTVLARLEQEGVKSTTRLKKDIGKKLLEDIIYFWEDDLETRSIEYLEIEHFQGLYALLLTDYDSTAAVFKLFPQVFAQGATAGGTARSLNTLTGDASIRMQYNEAKTAAQQGDWERATKIIEEMKNEMERKINDKIKNGEYDDPMKIFADWNLIANIWGEDAGKSHQDWANAAAEVAPQSICRFRVEVWAKNLKTFSDQRRELEEQKLYNRCIKIIEQYK